MGGKERTSEDSRILECSNQSFRSQVHEFELLLLSNSLAFSFFLSLTLNLFLPLSLSILEAFSKPESEESIPNLTDTATDGSELVLYQNHEGFFHWLTLSLSLTLSLTLTHSLSLTLGENHAIFPFLSLCYFHSFIPSGLLVRSFISLSECDLFFPSISLFSSLFISFFFPVRLFRFTLRKRGSLKHNHHILLLVLAILSLPISFFLFCLSLSLSLSVYIYNLFPFDFCALPDLSSRPSFRSLCHSVYYTKRKETDTSRNEVRSLEMKQRVEKLWKQIQVEKRMTQEWGREGKIVRERERERKVRE